MKKVSVIMPNYNHAPFLKERLDSIFAQDYPDKEVILLDDASTDESATVLKHYAERKEVTHCIVNDTNSGNTFIQWQKGLDLATGDYIWIAESDDVAEPTFLSRMVARLEEEEAVLVFCRSRWIDEHGKDLHRRYDARWNRDFSMEGKVFAKKYLLGYNTICNASAVLFRRSAAAQVDMTQVQRFTASGDRLFWIQIAIQGKVSYVAEPMNAFRQHTHKVSGSAEQKGITGEQDHTIYSLVAPSLSLTEHEKRLICGYHWQALHQPSVSAIGRERGKAAWSHEKAFGRGAWLVYMCHRIKEKSAR